MIGFKLDAQLRFDSTVFHHRATNVRRGRDFGVFTEQNLNISNCLFQTLNNHRTPIDDVRVFNYWRWWIDDRMVFTNELSQVFNELATHRMKIVVL
ncbi:hypothetical protein D3C75_1222500 [compost metagenome]